MSPLFPSFFLAGFECSTMRRADGRRNDLVAATAHERFAWQDYERLKRAGIRTAREGVAWHRIEQQRGRFDFSSALSRVRAARQLGIHVIWDLCHFGWPEDVDPFAADFAERLAAFAAAFATVLREETDSASWYAPVNEISFVSWAGGEVGYLNPFLRGRGTELKERLVRAALAAGGAVRAIDPRSRICHIDPIIHIAPDPTCRADASAYNEGQFEAWDMLGGRLRPEQGGANAHLDVVGVNFYDRNQWVDNGPLLAPGDAAYRPLRHLLADVHHRDGRPLFVAETGTEADARVAWLRYVCDEVAAALADGVPVAGICLYPVLDHPGWDDDRHVEVGLWGYPDEAGTRPAYVPLIEELAVQQRRFELLGTTLPS